MEKLQVMDDLDFTEEEIREQLEKLGYHVSRDRLLELKRDLEKLILHEKSRDSSQSSGMNGSTAESDIDPGFTERVPVDETNRIHQPTVNQPAFSLNHHSKENRATIHIPTSHPLQNKEQWGELPEDGVRYQGLPSTQANTSLASSASDRRFIKRRVARKVDGHSMVSDELTESEMGDVSSLEERLGHLDLDSGHRQRRHWSGDRPHTAEPYQQQRPNPLRRPQSADPVFRLPEDYYGPKALIKPMKGNPHTRNIRKTDPVSRFQQYHQCWQSQRAPGEKNHSNLRWSVREQMLYHDEVVQRKPKKVYVPNNYVIPSDKKRKSLRWAIRQDMAQGMVPPSMFD